MRRLTWTDWVALLGVGVGATDSIWNRNWLALCWVVIAGLWFVNYYLARKTSERWKSLYERVQVRHDRATWGRHLS